MGNSAKRDAKRVRIAERRATVLKLRCDGHSYEAVAEKVGLSGKSAARQDFEAALKQVIEEPAREVLAIELRRLDALLRGLWDKAEGGDLQAVDRALKIMDRRSAYLGLDAPKSVSFDLSRMTDDQIKQLLAGDATPLAAAGGSGTTAPSVDAEESTD